jgi:hypothetical protein
VLKHNGIDAYTQLMRIRPWPKGVVPQSVSAMPRGFIAEFPSDFLISQDTVESRRVDSCLRVQGSKSTRHWVRDSEVSTALLKYLVPHIVSLLHFFVPPSRQVFLDCGVLVIVGECLSQACQSLTPPPPPADSGPRMF